MDERAFKNEFSDFEGKSLINSDGKLIDNLRRPLQQTIDRLLERLYNGLDQEFDREDNYSVYTGIGGISLLHLHLYNVLGKDKGQLECAIDCLKHPLGHLKGRRMSFLCGDAGPLALGAVIYCKLNNSTASNNCIKRLEGLHKSVCEDPSLPDELLYGRVGYLYSLLFVQAHLGMDSIDTAVINKVYKVVIDSGMHMSQQQGWSHPLMYAWHNKHYLGAAHGLAGILYMLMQVKDEAVNKYVEELVRPSVEYMDTLRFPSGNCPSSLGSSTGDKLIHWCHGAPGWIHMYITAYKRFGEDRYLQAAKECAEVIWQRGLLKKGYGVCHGVAGNGYGLLAMYQLTDDQKYLYRAYKFAEWCFDYGNHGCRRPDAPLSLFEGLAGTVYFLTDLLYPKHAKFPAFAIP